MTRNSSPSTVIVSFSNSGVSIKWNHFATNAAITEQSWLDNIREIIKCRRLFGHVASLQPVTSALSRDVPNIRFVFASVPNSGPNSVFVFGRIMSSERIRIVSLYIYSAASDVYE